MTPDQTSDAIAQWRKEGCALLPEFFAPHEMAPLHADFETVFGTPESHFAEALARPAHDKNIGGGFDPSQFKNFKNLPFSCSPALNLLAVHPRLIALAQEALQCNDVLLYQGQAWAKYAGETDYTQPFHCDFGNHTLTVPAENEICNSITFIILISDVTEAHGPTHYVPKSLSEPIADFTASLSHGPELTTQLLPYARSTAGLSGTLFVYGIDVFHRATNITAPEGFRYVMTSCFKRADNTQIGYMAWPFHSHQPWQHIFNHATPQQLNCFGVPLPGDPFWTPQTLRLTSIRWPDWDNSAWQAAL